MSASTSTPSTPTAIAAWRAGLGNIQFVKDGDRLSGRASAEADFDALEDDEEVLGGDSGEELPDYLR